MIKIFLNKLVSGENLSEEEAEQVIAKIMQGELTPAQIASFLTALRIKGETIEEIAGCVRAMRRKSLKLKKSYPLAIDTCGTGGDGKGTFNISTVTALVAAGAGLVVAKHGNRAASSKSGSADVLEALGVNINLTPLQVEKCLEKIGIAFFFAPVFHPAMKYAISPRKEIGFRTIFNLLGPLTNPAEVKNQLLGVYNNEFTEVVAKVLKKLGSQSVMVVCGGDGTDEISITGPTKITQLKDKEIKTFYIKPEDLGLRRYTLEDIRGGGAKANAEITLSILKGEDGARREIVLLNSAAALVAGGKAKDLKEGINIATEVIDSGAALKKLEALRDYTKGLVG
ncbi:MAG TPA: anthranilate phosphoribosyltransferase [Candidatus Atribacteria bacterium]|nr:anthranilate phosphoribosyltransferase [Candidatus Atribacteria bacterium]